jgi:hypothetical protein
MEIKAKIRNSKNQNQNAGFLRFGSCNLRSWSLFRDMSLLSSTMVLYLVVGVGLAAAVYLSCKTENGTGLFFRITMAIPFWPLYLPILLSAPRSSAEYSVSIDSQPSSIPEDDMSVAIAQVDAELEAALNSLDGWAEDVLARERDRIRELRDAWNAQANRVREMDCLLAVLTPTLAPAPTLLDQSESRVGVGARTEIIADPSAAKKRLVHSQQACEQNIERLRLVRQRTYVDLLSNLAWVRELVSMIHLAKFTGAPASRAEELVTQIAAAVEGLSDLTWREEMPVSVAGNTSIPG